MVEYVRPEVKSTIADPACGTGGLFLGAYDFISSHHRLNKAQKEFLKFKTFHGNEIVANTRRLALMNMLLHGIGDIDAEPSMDPTDALIAPPRQTFDYVLTNPPFGKKSSITITDSEGKAEKEDSTCNRQDFRVTTSNKQLNFVQHVRSMPKSTGKAAIVVPDNVLFEGGAGETVRRKLLETTDLHTILRLPTGIFYAHGVKANVLFFDNRPAAKEPQAKEVWFYDYRTNIHHTLKKKPLRFEDLQEFIEGYNPENRHVRKETWHPDKSPDGRWRRFGHEEIISRDKASLDILWFKDANLTDLDNLPEPEVLAEEINESIEAALENFRKITTELEE